MVLASPAIVYLPTNKWKGDCGRRKFDCILPPARSNRKRVLPDSFIGI